LKEISHISATFAKHVLLGDALGTLGRLGAKECAFDMFCFFVISHDKNISTCLYFCKHAANRSIKRLQKIFCFPT
jgi:hypothetical protein